MRAAITKGRMKKSEYSLHEFSVTHAREGLNNYFPFRAVADCLKALSLKSRQELNDLIAAMADRPKVQEAWQQQLEAEEEQKKALQEVEDAMKAAEDVGEAINPGEDIPDYPFVDVKTGSHTNLHEILKPGPFTLFVLVRHFG